MAHQYLAKIFHDLCKNPAAPHPTVPNNEKIFELNTVLHVILFKDLYCFEILISIGTLMTIFNDFIHNLFSNVIFL